MRILCPLFVIILCVGCNDILPTSAQLLVYVMLIILATSSIVVYLASTFIAPTQTPALCGSPSSPSPPLRPPRWRPWPLSSSRTLTAWYRRFRTRLKRPTLGRMTTTHRGMRLLFNIVLDWVQLWWVEIYGMHVVCTACYISSSEPPPRRSWVHS